MCAEGALDANKVFSPVPEGKHNLALHCNVHASIFIAFFFV